MILFLFTFIALVVFFGKMRPKSLQGYHIIFGVFVGLQVALSATFLASHFVPHTILEYKYDLFEIVSISEKKEEKNGFMIMGHPPVLFPAKNTSHFYEIHYIDEGKEKVVEEPVGSVRMVREEGDNNGYMVTKGQERCYSTMAYIFLVPPFYKFTFYREVVVHIPERMKIIR